MTFTELGLRAELLRALGDEGYATPTPIQAQALPVALRGQDVLGCAQTGTGKTAAYLLPILERLAQGPRGRLRALIVTPTRELASQVGDSARRYGRHLPLRVACIFGGVGMAPQTEALRRGVDILVATPGRLLDHMARRHVSFGALEVLVLDEADRMLDMGFIPDVRRILAALPARRQNLCFSATMPREIEQLLNRTLRSPVVVEVTKRATPATSVRQVIHPVAQDRKKDLLVHLLTRSGMERVLVFTRTKARADRLAKFLSRTGRRVAAIHGDKSQGQRTRAFDAFRSGRVDTLLATDLAARGLDVEGISHVVNFDVPHVPEDYVHRIGRTARAEASGDAISLVSSEENGSVRAIERLIGMNIRRETISGFPAAAPPPTERPRHGPGPEAARTNAPVTGYRSTSRRRSRPRWSGRFRSR
jgi:ATP-dependent RNA helicase RhlE